MGLESAATLISRTPDEGGAHLDSRELTFRGRTKVTIPLAGARASAEGRRLIIETGSTTHRFDLASARDATHWAEKINSPRSRLQKLGITAESRVLIVGVDDAEFDDELDSAGLATPATTRIPARANVLFDVLLFAVREPKALATLARLAPLLAPKGGLWVLWPKGRKDLRHEEVVEAARGVGLSQTKSAAFNDELTGLRLTHAAARGSRA